MRHTLCIVLAMCLTFAAGCDGDDGKGNSDTPEGDTPGGDVSRDNISDNGPVPDATPVPIEPGAYTYRLDISDLTVWSTPATHRVMPEERAPEEVRSTLTMSAARHEFEPLQFVMDPGNGSVSVSIDPFPNLGASQRLWLSEVGYEQGWAERLTDLGQSGAVDIGGSEASPVWINVYVPKDAPAGLHTTNLVLTPAGGAAINVPVELYVFDFALPDDIGFASQMNISVSDLTGGGGAIDAHSMLHEHRFTPKSPTWPSGFSYNITWDSGANPQRCQAFYDEPDEGDEFAVGYLARRYLLGEGWNGVGYPNAMLFQFVDNSTPRPDTFCGESRGSHDGSSAYNAEWSAFLSGLGGYLEQNGMIDKGYYYVQNEPQDAADEALAAHLCRLTKAASPNLRIAVSEEPKPSIAEDPGGSCGYDIWIAHVRAFQEDYAKSRQRLGEQVWFYSLDQDPDPYYNPVVMDRQGIHQRIVPWVGWRYRAPGWAFYDFGRFFYNGQPGVRAELFREGFEDYEYLLLANNGGQPQVDVTEPADAAALSVASSLTSWNKDVDALMALRHELGLFIEGSRPTLPTLSVGGDLRPRAPYYLNFQDPSGSPGADPLEVDGKTWMKIGWDAYDAEAGYGWSGEHVGDASISLYGYDDVGGYSEVQKSYVFNDYGRDSLFEFELEPGRYDVTVGIGRPSRGYPDEPHNVTVEGVAVFDDAITTDSEPTLVQTTTIDLTDGSLSFEVGGKSALFDDWEYTFFAYVEIVPVD